MYTKESREAYLEGTIKLLRTAIDKKQYKIATSIRNGYLLGIARANVEEAFNEQIKDCGKKEQQYLKDIANNSDESFADVVNKLIKYAEETDNSFVVNYDMLVALKGRFISIDWLIYRLSLGGDFNKECEDFLNGCEEMLIRAAVDYLEGLADSLIENLVCFLLMSYRTKEKLCDVMILSKGVYEKNRISDDYGIKEFLREIGDYYDGYDLELEKLLELSFDRSDIEEYYGLLYG